MFETFEQAVKREVKEEIGVTIRVIKLLGICDHIIEKEQTHWISPSYLAEIIEGKPQILEPTKHLDMQWFNVNHLPENITITTKNALENYKKQIKTKE